MGAPRGKNRPSAADFPEYVARRKEVERQDPSDPHGADDLTSGELGSGPVITPPPPDLPPPLPPPQAPYPTPAQYGAPSQYPEPPPYAAPVPYTPPPAYPPPDPQAWGTTAPPAAKPRRTGRTLLIIGLIVLLILVALGVGAIVANGSLSSTYSPERAITDYLAAQKRGDANYMAANANFLRGDGSFSQYFDRDGLAAILAYPQNTGITDVKVASTTVVDSNTETVNATMTWNGHHVVRTYTLHKDPARMHYSFYSSWRIDIPFASIHITLPNQPGRISVDGFALPSGATSDIQVIQGFHKVTMDGTDFYDAASADADGIVDSPIVTFASTINATAKAAAATTIKKAFNTCNPVYKDCLGKTYYAPNQAGFIYFITVPGYGDVYYTRYVWSLTNDPTTNMKLTVEAGGGKVDASGACAYTWTVDGSRKYKFKGTWTATLTSGGPGNFGYDLVYDCAKSKA